MAKERAIAIIRIVGIPEAERRYKQYPHEFSGSMRQRIIIAIAMACKPDILIYDEPTTALDVAIQGMPSNLFHEIIGDVFAPRNPLRAQNRLRALATWEEERIHVTEKGV